jgi:hypothetical protein
MIEANFCSLVYTAFHDLKTKWPQLVRDIELGRVDPKLDVPEELRTKLNSRLRPDPKRASELKAEFDKGMDGIAKRVWPHLGLVFSVTTGANEIYFKMLKDRELKGVHIFSPLYGATEGLIGLNTDPLSNKRRYLLHPRTLFFEFIPITKADLEDPPTYFIDQVCSDTV